MTTRCAAHRERQDVEPVPADLGVDGARLVAEAELQPARRGEVERHHGALQRQGDLGAGGVGPRVVDGGGGPLGERLGERHGVGVVGRLVGCGADRERADRRPARDQGNGDRRAERERSRELVLLGGAGRGPDVLVAEPGEDEGLRRAKYLVQRGAPRGLVVPQPPEEPGALGVLVRPGDLVQGARRGVDQVHEAHPAEDGQAQLGHLLQRGRGVQGRAQRPTGLGQEREPCRHSLLPVVQPGPVQGLRALPCDRGEEGAFPGRQVALVVEPDDEHAEVGLLGPQGEHGERLRRLVGGLRCPVRKLLDSLGPGAHPDGLAVPAGDSYRQRRRQRHRRAVQQADARSDGEQWAQRCCRKVVQPHRPGDGADLGQGDREGQAGDVLGRHRLTQCRTHLVQAAQLQR